MKIYNKIFVILFLASFALRAQDEVFTITKTMPEFPGGVNQLRDFISSNMKYPMEALTMNYSGKVYFNFVVDTNGNILNPKIIKSSGHKCLDDEAFRIVNLMPKWVPGNDSLKKVKVSMNLPISFNNLGTLNAPLKEIKPAPVKLSPEDQAKHERAMKFWNDGHKLEQQFKFKDALNAFSKSLNEEPENKYALFDKGKMHMMLNEKDKACEIWNKMIQANIRKDEAEEFVKTYCVNDGHEKMVKYYDKLKSYDFFDKGMATVRTGRYEAAVSKFDSCLKYNPEHKDALFNKAQMHFNLDQKKAACQSWKKLLAINPSDKEVEELIKKHCN